RQRNHLVAAAHGDGVSQNDQRIVARLKRLRECVFELARFANGKRMDDQSELIRRGLRVFELNELCCVRRIPEYCDASELGNHVAQQLEALRAQLRAHCRGACDVAARLAEVRNEAGSFWVTNSYHDDWDLLGRFLGSAYR